MPILNADLFLIEDTSGVSKKIEASKLKANLAAGTYDDYKLLVNKPDYSSKFVYAQNMQGSVAPTDWMMVERGGVSYKVIGQQIIDFFPSLPAGVAGPITESGVTDKLTVESDTNLSDFVQGDALSMVDINGNVTGYVPVSSTITNVIEETTYKHFYANSPDDMGSTPRDNLLSIFTYNNVDNGTAPNMGQWSDAGQLNFGTDLSTIYDKSSCWLSKTANPIPFNVTRSGAIQNELQWFYCYSSNDGDNYTLAEVNLIDTSLAVSSFATTAIAKYWKVFKQVQSSPSPDPDTLKFKNIGTSNNSRGWNLYNNITAVTTLALANTQDLKYFKVGDTVQGFTPLIDTYMVVGTTADNPVDTIDATDPASLTNTIEETVMYGQIPLSNAGQKSIVFDTIFPVSKLQFTRFASGSSAEVVIYASTTGLPNSWIQASTPQNLGSGNVIELDATPYRYYLLTKTANGGTSAPSAWGISDNILKQNATVINVNLSVPNVIVGGGAWTGSDGTSSGDVADRETQVTGPFKSGTGNFNYWGDNDGTPSGPAVTLSTSNGDWIDNQNRLGENFYIKVASTRTGLAVLRTKAVAQAQDWVADASYLAEQLVKYNGRYWLALSSSYYNSPDTSDELDWFDLGPIS